MMVGGAVCYSAGLAATAVAAGIFEVMLGAGVLIGIALSCTAASLTMSATARVVPEARRSVMLGIVSATGSIGAFVAAPLAQQLIGSAGWRVAMFGFFGLSLAMIVATFVAGRVDRVDAGRSAGGASFGAVLRFAARDPAYLVMSGAYFVCGLQLVFLTTHLPSYLQVCGMDPMLSAEALAVIGLFNIAGSYGAGWLGQRYPKHVLLGLLYVLRSLAIAVYFSQPPTAFTTLVFAAAMGSLWLSVVPLMSGLVAQMYGVRFMATLIGISFMNHQIGSFLGAWGGGLIFDAFGSYDRAWQAAAIIGTIAGLAQIGFGAPRPGTGREALAPA
jgi:predicted MFS family arabinose efflux permease